MLLPIDFLHGRQPRLISEHYCTIKEEDVSKIRFIRTDCARYALARFYYDKVIKITSLPL